MIYLGNSGKVPYLDRKEIAMQAEEILERYWGKELPVDVEAICDRLGISILAVPNLAEMFYVDAFISADFKTIYVDEYEFDVESYRYRFSVAHELGHFILHRKYYPDEMKSLEEWLEVSRRIIGDSAEFQANCFAGNLLASEDGLIRVLNNEFGGSLAKNYWSVTPNELVGILEKVKKCFRVSGQVIARRMHETFPGVGEEVNLGIMEVKWHQGRQNLERN